MYQRFLLEADQMKEFNITGTCIPELHYMAGTDEKIRKIIDLIEKGKYFTINRPRQYGKTTTIRLIVKELMKKDGYLVINCSFEGLGKEAFSDSKSFVLTFIQMIRNSMENQNNKAVIEYIDGYSTLDSLTDLSRFITEFIKRVNKKTVIIIDEADRAGNYDLFIDFLGMLRSKYLKRYDDFDRTFQSVILSGVHDIKNLKLKMKSGELSSLSSPWNIASEFDVDMSFSPDEISEMLSDYERENETGMNVSAVSEEIFKFTNGYPFLVSKLCKIIDEKLNKRWTKDGIQNSISILLSEQNTLFDDLIKNIEHNADLADFLHSILIQGKDISYNLDNPVINKAFLYGIIRRDRNERAVIHNRIFEIRIYNYLVSKLETGSLPQTQYSFQADYLDSEGNIIMENLLLKFQRFIKEIYSQRDASFYEREGRLLLIAFIKPIINGSGFYYVEAQTSYERRSDIIITFNKKEYILELKIWYGEEYHKRGITQLISYMDSRGQSEGYLIIFNFNKNKEFKSQWLEIDGKRILEIMV